MRTISTCLLCLAATFSIAAYKSESYKLTSSTTSQLITAIEKRAVILPEGVSLSTPTDKDARVCIIYGEDLLVAKALELIADWERPSQVIVNIKMVEKQDANRGFVARGPVPRTFMGQQAKISFQTKDGSEFHFKVSPTGTNQKDLKTTCIVQFKDKTLTLPFELTHGLEIRFEKGDLDSMVIKVNDREKKQTHEYRVPLYWAPLSNYVMTTAIVVIDPNADPGL